ncbi:MAG: DUF2809 domain-containing protein [Steroidobacteraceae bacterium]
MWIVGLRESTPGHLVLGSTFSPWNLPAYSVGVAIGALGESAFGSRAARRRSDC